MFLLYIKKILKTELVTWIFPMAPIATSGGKITGLAYVPPI